MTAQPTTESIWLHLSADLRRFIRRRVSDENVADDLLQETFVRVHRNIGGLQQADRLAAWVYQIARNVVHDHHRKGLLLALPLGDADPFAHEHDEREAGCGCGTWLEEMVQSLPDGYREAVHMAEIEELSQQEVADNLGLSHSGAKSRIQRGRAMLKETLERCCRFELDGRGRVTGCDPRPNQSASGCGCECGE